MHFFFDVVFFFCQVLLAIEVSSFIVVINLSVKKMFVLSIGVALSHNVTLTPGTSVHFGICESNICSFQSDRTETSTVDWWMPGGCPANDG